MEIQNKTKNYFNSFGFKCRKNDIEDLHLKKYKKWYNENSDILNKYTSLDHACQISRLCYFYYSRLKDEEMLLEFMKMMILLFIIDDLSSISTKYTLNCVELIKNKKVNEYILKKDLCNLILENYNYLEKLTDDKNKLKNKYLLFLYGCIEEQEYKPNDFNIEEYIEIRSKTSAMQLIFFTCEIAYKLNFEKKHGSDIYNKLIYYVYTITCLTNDLYSLKKEIRNKENLNFVILYNKLNGEEIEKCIIILEKEIQKIIKDSGIVTKNNLTKILNKNEYLLYADLIEGQTWWSKDNIRYNI